MTCKEKFIKDHPDYSEKQLTSIFDNDCPGDYGIMDDPHDEDGYPNCYTVCADCWNREITETDENKKENIIMPTTKKTKAELLEEIEQLHKELEEIKNAELYQQGANQLKVMHAAYMIAGFTDEQSFELLLTMIRAGIKH